MDPANMVLCRTVTTWAVLTSSPAITAADHSAVSDLIAAPSVGEQNLSVGAHAKVHGSIRSRASKV